MRVLLRGLVLRVAGEAARRRGLGGGGVYSTRAAGVWGRGSQAFQDVPDLWLRCCCVAGWRT